MRRWLFILLTIGWLVAAGSLASPVVKAHDPVVRAVLFWSESCPHCHEVMDHVIPPLEEKYGDQLEVRAIEISDPDNYPLWVAAMETFQVPPERQGVPMLFIGDTVLIGSREIPEKLPGLIEQHLAAGGVDYPAIPGLGDILEVTASPAPTPTPAPIPTPTVQGSEEPVIHVAYFYQLGCQECDRVQLALDYLKSQYPQLATCRAIAFIQTSEVLAVHSSQRRVSYAQSMLRETLFRKPRRSSTRKYKGDCPSHLRPRRQGAGDAVRVAGRAGRRAGGQAADRPGGVRRRRGAGGRRAAQPQPGGAARPLRRERRRATLPGLGAGLVASQCATPVLAAILTYVMSRPGALAYGAALLFIYALGRGVPVVLAGTFTGALKGFRALGRWSGANEKASAVIILGVGLYFLWIA